MSLHDFDERVKRLVRDEDALLTEGDREAAIAAAVTRYSLDRPRTKVEDITLATAGQLLDLPAGWETDFSALRSLEYPIGDVPPTLIGSWQLYQSPTAIQIQLASGLAAGAVIRANYTIAHQVDTGQDTVPSRDRAAVANFAAARLAGELAALYAGDQAPTIAADSIDHADKSRKFSALANALRKRYFDALGINPKRTVAAGVVVDMDLKNSLGGDRLTHSGRYR